MRTLYHNASVYTGQLPLQEAFIVEDGRFGYVGSRENAPEADREVDLGGAFVCAGFTDSHMHLLNFGQTLTVAPLAKHTGSLEEMLGCLSRTAPGRGGWILGRGWNQDLFSGEKRMPTRQDLDQVSKDSPVCAVRCCGHALSLNSKALELLGITPETPQIEGGQIVMEAGQPNGILLDNAMELALSAIPAPNLEEIKDMIRRGARALNARGITGCHSDDYSAFSNVPWETVNRAFRELEEAGELTVRVYEQANFPDAGKLEAFLNRERAEGDLFRIGPLKLLGDGALGARTAYLSRGYGDDPENRGLTIFTQEEFDTLIGMAHRSGMQAAVHCIGDACLDMVLDAMEKALAEYPREDHRHGIIHCQITRPDQLRRMAEMKLHIYCQSIFLDYDIHIVEQRAGKELAQSSYSWKTLKNMGATVSNGSDCPVEAPDVMGGIQCAVTRKDLKGFDPYLPEEAFTVQEALDSFTKGGAYAAFREEELGRIEAGYEADFVVLGEDPFAADPCRLKDIPIKMTFLQGRQVY